VKETATVVLDAVGVTEVHETAQERLELLVRIGLHDHAHVSGCVTWRSPSRALHPIERIILQT